MKNLTIKSSLLLLTLSMPCAYALQCPDNNQAPLCPTSGATLLDETYPTQAFVISNQPMIETKASKKVTQNFINKVIASYDYKNVPQIILPITEQADYESLKANIRNTLTQKRIPTEDINKIIEQITYVPARSYTWQQDWFESFVDLKTGSPVVRQIESYNRVPQNLGDQLVKDGAQCSMKNGDTVKSAYPTDPYATVADVKANKQSFGSAEMGGNIEGAPGGFCMVGDNQGAAFTEQFCGSKDNVIQLQTSWLSVGHVDEIFKIMPTQYNDGRPKECEFSLMAASPKKALELMSHPAMGQMPFVDLDINNSDVDQDEARSSRSAIGMAGNFYLCNYIVYNFKVRNQNRENIPQKAKSVFMKILFGGEALAQTPPGTDLDTYYKNLNEECSKNIDKISNFDLQEVMKLDPEITKLNQAINTSIEKDKALIKQKILSRLPQCAKYYNEIDAPNLFYGGQTMTNADGSVELKKPGTTDSFLPNPTNSVLMNKTVVFPDSGNKLFNNYMTEELKKRNMKADYLSTWDYAHIGHGNIHCSSHSINHCRPQGKQ